MADEQGGAKTIQQMIDGGAPVQQVYAFRDQQRKMMLEGGAPSDQVDKYWGIPNPNMAGAKAQVVGNLNRVDPMQGAAIAKDPLEAFAAGWDMSVSHLMYGPPKTQLPKDPTMLQSLAAGAAGFAGDLPFNVAGFFGGAAGGGAAGALVPGAGETGASEAAGAAIGSYFGTGALPQAMRGVLMDHYAHPNDGILTSRDLWARSSQIAWDTTKAGAESLIGGRAGEVAGKLATPIVGKLAGGLTNASTFAAAATATGAVLDQRVPTKQDVATAVVLTLGAHTAGSLVGATKRFVPSAAGRDAQTNVRDIYSEKGVEPLPLAQTAQTDLSIKHETLAPRAPDGHFVTPGIDAHAPPEPEPYFKTDPKATTPPEDASLQSERIKPEDPRAAGLPEATLDLVRALERSGDQAVSPKGAVGRFQIMPDTARQYGFDPSKLTDPDYNAKVAQVVLNDLQRKFPGDLAAQLVAYNAGPGRARAWVNSGRDYTKLPVETQKYLEHAERLGKLDPTITPAQQDAVLHALGDDGSYQPDPGKPFSLREGIKSNKGYNWLYWGGDWENTMVTRHLPNGDIVPAPETIASYLQKFGEEAGFKFQISKPLSETSEGHGPSGPAYEGIRRASEDKSVPLKGQVRIPDNSEDQMRAWYGLGHYEVLAHEVGHALDVHVLNGGETNTTSIRDPALKDEMIATSKRFRPKLWEENPKYNMRPQELMADNIAQWLTNPEMRSKMPLFEKKYGPQLQKYLDIANRNLPRQSAGGQWSPPPDPEEQVEVTGGGNGAGKPPAPPGSPGPKPEPPRKPEQITNKRVKPSYEMAQERMLDFVAPEVTQGKWPDWMNPRQLVAGFQQRLVPARRLDKILNLSDKALGIEDIYRQVYGSAGRGMYIIRYGTLDPTAKDNEITETSNESFFSAYNAVKEDGGTIPGFEAYRLAKRVVELAGRGIDVGSDPHTGEPRLQTAMDLLSFKQADKEYSRANAIMQRVKNAVVDYTVNSGMISPEKADAIKELNQQHIVFRRLMDPAYNPPGYPSKSFTVRNPFKKIEGSDRRLVDPTTADIDNVYTLVAMADRNRAIGSIIGAIEQHNASLKSGQLPVVLERSQVLKDEDIVKHGEILDENGIPVPDRAGKAAAEPFLASKKLYGRLGPNDFVYFRQGKPEVWTVADPDLADLFRMSWPGKVNPVATLLTKFASLSRAGITATFDYPFRALIHGQLASTAFSKESAVPFHDLMKGVMSPFKMDEAYKQWVRNGGANSALSDIDVNYARKDVDKLFQETGTDKAVWNSALHPIDAMRALQHNVDSMSRIGYTSRLVNKGYSPMKAATMSRTAFLDNAEGFSAQWVDTFSRMVPFMRVGFKDIDQVSRAITERPVTTLAKVAAVLIIPTLVNYAINREFDKKLPPEQQYQNFPRWARDLYWILPPINGVRYKIKRPYVGGYLFATLPERLAEYATTDETLKEAFNESLDSLVAQVMPPFMPTAFLPEAEQIANKSFFTGRPLIKASLEKAAGYLQYQPNTTITAKKIASVLGPPHLNLTDVSPIILDNYARQWAGSLPMTVLHMLETPFNPDKSPKSLADVPFVGAFIAREPGFGAQPIEDFYTAYAKVESATASKRVAMEHADTGEILSTSMDPNAALRVSTIAKALHGLQISVNAISQNPDMKDYEKRQVIDQMYGMAILEAKAGLQIMKSGRH